MGMGEGVFIEMVDVGDAKVERGQEDEADGREVGDQVQGHEEGAEQELFRDGALQKETY